MNALARVLSPYRHRNRAALYCDGLAWSMMVSMASLRLAFGWSIYSMYANVWVDLACYLGLLIFIKILSLLFQVVPKARESASDYNDAHTKAICGFLVGLGALVWGSITTFVGQAHPFWQGPRAWLGVIAVLAYAWLLIQVYTNVSAWRLLRAGEAGQTP